MQQKAFNNISGLQLFSFLKFITFLIISVVLTKSYFTPGQIGEFEAMLFIANIVSYWWMTGLIQSFLPLYNNNAAFPGYKIDENHRSPEIFNGFILIFIFSMCIFIIGHVLKNNIYIFSNVQRIENANLLLIYILLSNPAHLVEYIYLLRNKSNSIVIYGLVTYSLQLALVLIPVIMGYGVKEALEGLVAISILRMIWLFALMIKYAKFKISFRFLKDHIKLGYPLIISSLLSGSAQYVDGIVVSSKFDNAQFALFRYGAKEFPFLVMLVMGLHNAMIPELSIRENFDEALKKLKRKTLRLFHILFPLTAIFLFFSDFIYPNLFNEEFNRSSDIFMVYLLMIVSRVLFPNTVLISLKKTNVIMIASVVELIMNVLLSYYLIQYYGLVGVALATVIIYLLEKLILVGYVWVSLKIPPQKYTPVIPYLIYSAFVIALFVLIDRRILDVF